jgi:hypothetical protein
MSDLAPWGVVVLYRERPGRVKVISTQVLLTSTRIRGSPHASHSPNFLFHQGTCSGTMTSTFPYTSHSAFMKILVVVSYPAPVGLFLSPRECRRPPAQSPAFKQNSPSCGHITHDDRAEVRPSQGMVRQSGVVPLRNMWCLAFRKRAHMAASTCHVKITMSGVRAAPSYVTEQLSAKSLDVAQPKIHLRGMWKGENLGEVDLGEMVGGMVEKW